MTPADQASPSSTFDIVCFSHLRWRFVFQRPQHLLSRWAREHRVFYVEEPVEHDGPTFLEITEVQERVWVVVPFLPRGTTPEEAERTQRGLVEHLIRDRKIGRYVLWFYSPAAVPLARNLEPLATVYDCMDELSAFEEAARDVAEREGELFDSADLVFTGGQSLFEAKRERHRHVHLFPSSVDVPHFASARTQARDPEDQAGIGRPRLGFFGVIDERLDRDLLAGIARLRPDWQIVMVGPVVKIPPEALPTAPNIHYLGAKPYEELPAYVGGWDLAILPFARNAATRFISPTKTPEYLAAGRPVVSTSITDVVRPYRDLGLVRIADDPEGFVAAAETAMAEDEGERLGHADAFLADTSWDRTWEEMRRLVEGVVTTRAASAPAPTPNGNGARRVDLTATDRAPGATVEPFDYLVVGAGFAGSVLAERLAADAGKRVLVVERRQHIGGNAYDEYDAAGLLIHRYGPHIFHTNSAEVFTYLSRFTEWRPYEHRVLASVDGQLVPIPINLDTINTLYGLSLSSAEVEDFLAERAEPIESPRTSEDVVVRRVGRELYEKFFRNYTRKQWDLDPSELDASVTARVPIRTNRDPRYFTDTYQAMPREGYTRMFERMLDHPNIKVMLNTDHREAAAFVPHRQVIYTGPVDEFFGFRFGKLPYRSLEFRFETHERDVHQPAPVINFPNEHLYTRVTEFKYLTGQRHPKTTLVYEYPRAEGDPYYPVPRPENAALYRRYKELAEATPGVHFVGRLATYRYYNMDQVVAQALAVYARIAGPTRPTTTVNGNGGLKLDRDDDEPVAPRRGR